MASPGSSATGRSAAQTSGPGWTLLREQHAGPFRLTIKQYASWFRQSRHAHELGTIDFTLAGGGRGTCGHEEVVSRPGRVEFFAPGRDHDFASGPRGIRTLHVAFPPAALNPERRGQAARDDVMGVDAATAAGVAARLAMELRDPDESSTLACECLAQELLGATTRWRDRPEPGARWLAWARAHLHEGERCSLQTLAALAGVHPSHLARSFSAQYGLSPGEYHRRLRLARAAESLAREPTPLARVARDTGFADQAHLTRWFKRMLGITPGAFAREMRSHAGAF